MKKIVIRNKFTNEIILEKEYEYVLDLRHADLRCSNLSNADLRCSNLSNADLSNADLRNAYLRNADLRCSNLSNADLSNADLSYADLSNADLSYADLRNADLDEKEKIRKGIIIKQEKLVYKKCDNKIVELELQKGSIVFSINNNKCRTNKAKVISIDNNYENGTKISSDYDENFVYEVGKIVEVEDFDLIYNVECSTGIHFFFNKNDAEKY